VRTAHGGCFPGGKVAPRRDRQPDSNHNICPQTFAAARPETNSRGAVRSPVRPEDGLVVGVSRYARHGASLEGAKTDRFEQQSFVDLAGLRERE
jgi:hypothetical protein